MHHTGTTPLPSAPVSDPHVNALTEGPPSLSEEEKKQRKRELYEKYIRELRAELLDRNDKTFVPDDHGIPVNFCFRSWYTLTEAGIYLRESPDTIGLVFRRGWYGPVRKSPAREERGLPPLKRKGRKEPEKIWLTFDQLVEYIRRNRTAPVDSKSVSQRVRQRRLRFRKQFGPSADHASAENA